MSRIFISYRRSDSNAETGRIYDYLESRFGAEEVFKDVDTINSGSNFGAIINEALDQCQVFLAIIGKNWLEAEDALGNRRLENATDWVRLEISTALERRDIQIIPVLIDTAKMPSADELPQSLRSLTRKQAALIRNDPDFRQDMNKLVNEINRCFTTLPSSIDSVSLISEKNIDYRKLKSLLKERKWSEADVETRLVMAKVVDENPRDVPLSSFENFPCKDLQTIDQLWITASGGHFGFSVQKEIWEKCGRPKNILVNKEIFCDLIGWRVKNTASFMEKVWDVFWKRPSSNRIMATKTTLKYSLSESLRGELPYRAYFSNFINNYRFPIAIFKSIQKCKTLNKNT